MKNHFLPKRLTSSGVTALASIVVVLQTRNTFHLQLVPVIGSVWPPGTIWNTFFSFGHLRHRVGDAGIHVAEDHVDLIAVDQLARLLHAGADVVGRILDQKLDLAAENAALLVDFGHGVFGAVDLALRQRRQHAGQRIDHADLDRLLAASRDEKRRANDLAGAECKTRLEQRAAAYGQCGV